MSALAPSALAPGTLAPPIQARFALVDQEGRPVTERTYRGAPMLVLFGFTHCRVVCPRQLAKHQGALDAIAPAGDCVQPLYISVDPARDTPDVLRAWLAAQAPRFTGLTGTPEAVAAAMRAFRVHARRRDDPAEPDGYAMPHTAISFLLDAAGAYAAHFPEALDQAELARRLLAHLA